MKRFIIYVLLFVGSFLFSDLLLVYITKKSFDEQVFKLPANKQILILGDSRLECALNDSILDNAVNLCHSGEAYIYTYVKMKRLLTANPHIRTVWLSFNFSSLQKESEEWLYNREGVLNIDRYACFLGGEEKTFFAENSRYYLGNMRLPYTYRGLMFHKITGKANSIADLRWGGFLRLGRNNLRNGQAGISGVAHIDESSIQCIYLNKIVEYCTDNAVSLIFINSPIKKEPLSGRSAYYHLYKKKYSNIQLWDYSNLLLPDSCYADAEHLNYKGAEVFSRYLLDCSTGMMSLKLGKK